MCPLAYLWAKGKTNAVPFSLPWGRWAHVHWGFSVNTRDQTGTELVSLGWEQQIGLCTRVGVPAQQGEGVGDSAESTSRWLWPWDQFCWEWTLLGRRNTGLSGWEVRGWAAAAGEDLLAEGLCRVPRWCQHHAVSEAASIMGWVKPSVLAQICPCGIRASPLWPHLVIFQRPHLQIPGKIKFPPS